VRRLLALRKSLALLTIVALVALPGTGARAAATQTAAVSGTADLAAGTSGAGDPRQLELGRRLYEDGIGVDGLPIQVLNPQGPAAGGAEVACIRCHRRSGMGTVEGMIRIPPICGRALHAGKQLRDRVIMSMDGSRGRGWNAVHPPYDADSFARAVREGQNADGHTMLTLMPRFALGDQDLAALSVYLDALSAQWSAGVDEHTVEFATVLTPGLTPQRRQAFLDTLQAAFEIKNSNTMPGHRHMINAAEMIMNLERHWHLQIWELSGPEASWAGQLDALYRAHPVFAVVSGLSSGGWAPVQALCDRERMPCWFPSVPVPPAHQGPRDYGLYFQEGVRLEARVLGQALAELPQAPQRLLQIHGAATAGRSAADALDATLATSGLGHSMRQSRSTSATEWAHALAELRPGDALALWLSADELPALLALPPPSGVHIYLSAVMAGAEHAPLPERWRDQVTLIYPYELPSRRIQNMATFHSWLALHQIALVDEVMQSEVFFSVNYLQFTMSEMLDNVYRDLLLERGQDMLRRRELQRAEEETLMRMQGHPPARAVGAASQLAPGAIYGTVPNGPLSQARTQRGLERQGTTIYPRLSLAIGQHFASKGAYLARFSGLSEDASTSADTPQWITPQVLEPASEAMPTSAAVPAQRAGLKFPSPDAVKRSRGGAAPTQQSQSLQQ
jgi:cytochrome c553